MTGHTYDVALWDHEVPGGGTFCGRLAADHLALPVEGHPCLPAAGLCARDVVRALRKLRALGWDDAGTYVVRDDGGGC
jgi:hypothetical protein